MSAAKVKARKMWKMDRGELVYPNKRWASYEIVGKICKVYVLPADAASVEHMVEQMAEAMYRCTRPNAPMPVKETFFAEFLRREASAALAAIGVKCTKNKHDAKTCQKNGK